ncbi:MAG: AMP-binding protein [Bacteroidales bacterium]
MADLNLLTLPSLLENSVKKFGPLPVMSYVEETPISYAVMDKQVKSLVAFFQKLGVQKGDKIAILGHNMPNWGISYFAITSMGAVAVPLLPDFTSIEVTNVLEHSETRILLVSERLMYKITDIRNENIRHLINLDSFTLLDKEQTGACYTEDAIPEIQYEVEENELAAIIYTSGTTGKQKGVMLSHKNIVSNAIAGGKVQYINEDDVFLSLLPLSHTYENTLGLILPVLKGASIVYFRLLPSPQLIADALIKVRPTLLLTVPLIIEKMYRAKVLPGLKEKKIVWTLYKVPVMRKLINKGAGKKLRKAFGGRLKFFGIGGAKLDPVVEKFLMEAGFPIAIGYGLTESSPLLAGTNPTTLRLQSTGPSVDGVTLKLVSASGNDQEGEIWAKGPNIMKGYYKDAALTSEVITEDGWLRTGDLGSFDKEGYLFIKGRIKNTILGSNGENIYPEEIESVINNFKHVIESVVVEQKGKLVAIVHFNRDEIENACRQMYGEIQDKVEHKIEELRHELQEYVNSRVKKFSRIHKVVIQQHPFQKTATQKIKRYLISLSPYSQVKE